MADFLCSMQLLMDGNFNLILLTRSYDIVKLIAQHPGIDLNQKDSHGHNCFWNASKHGKTSIMLLLAKNGVDISNVSNNGLNALHIAVTQDFEDVVKLLISYDFPINERTNSGMTALLISVYKRHHSCLEALLNSKQADLELPTKDGMTPLQLALK